MNGPGGLIWVVGAGSGIGRALALQLASPGRRLILSGRGHSRLEDVAADVGSKGAETEILAFDVTDSEQLEAAVSRLLDSHGPPDTLIFSAGDHQAMPLPQLSTALCRRLMEVNYFSIMHMLELLLPPLRARGSGTIGIIASLAGYRGLPTAAAYGASKAAVINACEALASELSGSGITLKVINPGFVRTPLTDRNRFKMPCLIEADEAADAILRSLFRPGFEIAFPRRFVWLMKLLRVLPYRIYFPLIRRRTGL